MIYLFTDFGIAGPYVGQVKSVLARISPAHAIIDLMHDAPAFNPLASAVLLAALSDYMEVDSITLAVVDPGVGAPQRRPVMVKADGRWFVGPDNGLLYRVMEQADNVACYELVTGENISKTFHGRDVFAPAAAALANEQRPEGRRIAPDSLVTPGCLAPLSEVIYIDHYGNAMTGLRREDIGVQQCLRVKDAVIHPAETFSSVGRGELFWCINSIGLVEISKNCGSAAAQLDLAIGTSVITIAGH